MITSRYFVTSLNHYCNSFRLNKNINVHANLALRSVAQDEMINNLRKEEIFIYSTQKFDFKGQLLNVFMEEHYFSEVPSDVNLSKLHEIPVGSKSNIDGSGNEINYFQWRWNKDRSRLEMSSSYQSFNNLYIQFIHDIIGPIMGGGRIIYQRAHHYEFLHHQIIQLVNSIVT